MVLMIFSVYGSEYVHTENFEDMAVSSLTWSYKLLQLAWTVFSIELAANTMISVTEWRSYTSTVEVQYAPKSSEFCVEQR